MNFPRAIVDEFHLNSLGKFIPILAVVFVLLFCANLLIFIGEAASPVIRSDLWVFADSLVRKWALIGISPSDIFYKRNIFDHAQPLYKIVLYLNYRIFRLDFRLDAVVGVFAASAIIASIVVSYFKIVPQRNRTILSLLMLLVSISVFGSMNVTEPFTWPLVTFSYVYLLLALGIAYATWVYLTEGLIGFPLAISVTAYVLCGDTLTVIVWASLTVSVMLWARHAGDLNAKRAKLWFVASSGFVLCMYVAINYRFLFMHEVPDHLGSGGAHSIWRNPHSYLEIFRVVFSYCLVYGDHLAAFGRYQVVVSWVLACIVFYLYWKFIISVITGAKRIDIVGFVVLFFLVYASVEVFGVLVGRVTTFGVEYLERQTRYVMIYQLIPFSLALESAFVLSGRRLPTKLKSAALFCLAIGLLGLQFIYVKTAYTSVYWLSKFTDHQSRAIGAFLNGGEMPPDSCISNQFGRLCKMGAEKQRIAVEFLYSHQLNIFNREFQWRYKLFPFDFQGNVTKVVEWGPKSIRRGEVTNVLMLTRQLNELSEYVVSIDGQTVIPTVDGDNLSFNLPVATANAVGDYRVSLIDKRFKNEVLVGVVSIQ